MIRFFQTPQKTTDSNSRSVIATEVDHALSEQEIKELTWLYGEATLLDADHLDGRNHPEHGTTGHQPHRGIFPRCFKRC